VGTSRRCDQKVSGSPKASCPMVTISSQVKVLERSLTSIWKKKTLLHQRETSTNANTNPVSKKNIK
jgi:hypothetical protein